MAFGPENVPSRRSAAWTTALWLGLFLAIGLFLRIGFSAETGFDDGTQRYLYTGNDPYYHDRTIHHILDTGEHLVFDPAINYPAGGYNPNPPLFDWTTVPVAVGLDAAGVADPVGLSLNIMVAVWGALVALPVYLLGRDLWGRTAGLWAAFLASVSAPHIQRTIFGFADHDATTLFFITLAFAFLVKALKAVSHKEYVSDWRSGAARAAGLKAVFAENRTAFLWSALAGVALTATAVTWKGYPYALAVMAVGIAFQLLNDHLRNRDSSPVFLLYLLPLVMVVVLPYLLLYRAFPTFLDTTVVPSVYVLVGVALAGLVLVPTRQLPSVLVFPGLAVLAAAGLAFLYFVMPDAWAIIFTGLGYFQQSKLYSTIAEAQRASLGFVAASFGFFTFLLAFWGLGKAIRGTYRGEPAFTLVFAWSAVALFMAFAASRFVLNAAPVLLLLTGAATAHLSSKIGFSDVRRRFQARSGNAVMGALKSLTVRTGFGAALLALLVVLPNVWIGVDAAMPSDYEAEKNLDARLWGAFGIGYELKSNGWLATMDHLASLDTGVPIEERPAFVAWWDYGHWATGIGLHPTVADPFQNHYNLAGRFLASESEEEGVAWLTILMLNTDYARNGGFSPDVRLVLESHDAALLQIGELRGYDAEFAAYNATVDMGSEEPFDLYEEVMVATGDRIQYLGVDRRMFPLSAQNEGIFYAPVYLANKNPDDFVSLGYPAGGLTLTFQRYAMDEDGNSVQLADAVLVDARGDEYEIVGNQAYPLGKTPLQGYSETTGLQLGEATLDVKDRFGRTMYARAYGGITTETAPGGGLRHWRAIQESTAPLQGEVEIRNTALLEYYAGAVLSGTVRDDAGEPMAGVEVTVQDGFGATHDTATTGTDGRYQVLAPFGDDLSVLVRSGGTVLYADDSLLVSRAEADTGAAKSLDLTVARADLIGHAYRDLDGEAGFNGTVDEALAGVTVTAGGQTEVSDSFGLYSFVDLPAGGYLVRATADGYEPASASVALRADETRNQDLALRPTPSTVNVTFLDDGTGVAGIPVRIEGPQARSVTTGDGGLARTILEPGDYEAVVDYTFNDAQGLEVRYDVRQAFTVPFGGAPFELVLNA